MIVVVTKICKSFFRSSFLSLDLGNPFKGISKEVEEGIAGNKKKEEKKNNLTEEEDKAANTAKLLLRFAPSNLINQTVIRFIILNINFFQLSLSLLLPLLKKSLPSPQKFVQMST